MERVEASLRGEKKQLKSIGEDFYQGSMKAPIPKTESAVYPVTVTAHWRQRRADKREPGSPGTWRRDLPAEVHRIQVYRGRTGVYRRGC